MKLTDNALTVLRARYLLKDERCRPVSRNLPIMRCQRRSTCRTGQENPTLRTRSSLRMKEAAKGLQSSGPALPKRDRWQDLQTPISAALCISDDNSDGLCRGVHGKGIYKNVHRVKSTNRKEIMRTGNKNTDTRSNTAGSKYIRPGNNHNSQDTVRRSPCSICHSRTADSSP